MRILKSQKLKKLKKKYANLKKLPNNQQQENAKM